MRIFLIAYRFLLESGFTNFYLPSSYHKEGAYKVLKDKIARMEYNIKGDWLSLGHKKEYTKILGVLLKTKEAIDFFHLKKNLQRSMGTHFTDCTVRTDCATNN